MKRKIALTSTVFLILSLFSLGISSAAEFDPVIYQNSNLLTGDDQVMQMALPAEEEYAHTEIDIDSGKMLYKDGKLHAQKVTEQKELVQDIKRTLGGETDKVKDILVSVDTYEIDVDPNDTTPYVDGEVYAVSSDLYSQTIENYNASNQMTIRMTVYYNQALCPNGLTGYRFYSLWGKVVSRSGPFPKNMYLYAFQDGPNYKYPSLAFHNSYDLYTKDLNIPYPYIGEQYGYEMYIGSDRYFTYTSAARVTVTDTNNLDTEIEFYRSN